MTQCKKIITAMLICSVLVSVWSNYLVVVLGYKVEHSHDSLRKIRMWCWCGMGTTTVLNFKYLKFVASWLILHKPDFGQWRGKFSTTLFGGLHRNNLFAKGFQDIEKILPLEVCIRGQGINISFANPFFNEEIFVEQRSKVLFHTFQTEMLCLKALFLENF